MTRALLRRFWCGAAASRPCWPRPPPNSANRWRKTQPEVCRDKEERRRGRVATVRRYVWFAPDAGRQARCSWPNVSWKTPRRIRFSRRQCSRCARNQTENRQSPVKPSSAARLWGARNRWTKPAIVTGPGRDFADVAVRDGKTGGDLYNERFTDKRLLMLPSLDEPSQSWPTTRKITVKPVEYVNTHSAAAIR